MKRKIKLMKLDEFDEFKNIKDTIENISYDKENKEYMSNSKLEIFNFDKVKNNFAKKHGIADDNKPKSADGCQHKDNNIIFIEFKNGEITSKAKRDIRCKMLNSVLILSAITDNKISYLKNICQFILVYNQEKNGDINLSINLNKDAKQQNKSFDLSGYDNVFFSKTDLFNKNEFETFLK